MRTVGQVEIERLDLAAKCAACGKVAVKEDGWTLIAWKLILAAFIDQHRECDGK